MNPVTEITEEIIQSHIVASILENDQRFNLVVRQHLEAYKAGRITLSRFCQLRNNARGNALQHHTVSR
jgi:hypothetical protein